MKPKDVAAVPLFPPGDAAAPGWASLLSAHFLPHLPPFLFLYTLYIIFASFYVSIPFHLILYSPLSIQAPSLSFSALLTGSYVSAWTPLWLQKDWRDRSNQGKIITLNWPVEWCQKTALIRFYAVTQLRSQDVGVPACLLSQSNSESTTLS